MKKRFYVACVVIIISAACEKKDSNSNPTTTSPSITAKGTKAIIFDYHDGTVDSVFQDSSTNKVIRTSGNWTSTIRIFSTTKNGIAIIRQNGATIEGYDTVSYSNGLPIMSQSYESNHTPSYLGIISFTYHIGNNPASENISTKYLYDGTRLIGKDVSPATGDTVRYYYGSNPKSNKLNTTNDELKNAYTIHALTVNRQITDAIFYSSHLPDSIVYTLYGWKGRLTYDTTVDGMVKDIFLNGTKKITITQ